ncbi:MAG: hypothetical protein ABIP27_04575 [Flavobacterium circumlabens]|uniref:hypothetical protein n=1 Tax=Flavobacterium circumlabens TaxID=2133765 RepID=UPI0032642213
MKPKDIINFLKKNDIQFYELCDFDELIAAYEEIDIDFLNQIGEIDFLYEDARGRHLMKVLHFKNHKFYIREDAFLDSKEENFVYVSYSIVNSENISLYESESEIETWDI